MKRKLPLLIVLIATLSGCSFNKQQGDPNKTLIKFFGWGSTIETEIFRDMINEFEQLYPNYNVYYEPVSSENYITVLASKRNNPKNMPDVFYMPDINFVQWVNSRNNIMKDLTPYIESSETFELSNVWSEGINAYQFDPNQKKLGTGGIYGLPKDLGPVALTYNKDIVKSKGVTIISDTDGTVGYDVSTKTLNDKVAMTWAQFVKFCDDVRTGDPASSGSIVGVTHYPLEAAYFSMGGDFTDSTRKTATIDNDKYAESLQFVADLSNKFKVMTTAEGQATQNGIQRFTSGLAACSFIEAFQMPTLWKASFDWDLLYTPVPNQTGDLTNYTDGYREGASSQSYLGSVAISVYKDSKVPEAAYRLCEFLTVHPTAQRINYEKGQAVPNLIDMARGEYLTAQLEDGSGKNRPTNREVYVDMMDTCKRRPQAYTYNADWYNEMWESENDATKLYRVFNPGSSMYGTHIDVWDWDTRTRLNPTFLQKLQASCQAKLNKYKDNYKW